MRFFFLRDYQDWLVAVFLGALLAVLIHLGFRSYGYSRREARGEESSPHPDRVEGRGPPVPMLILFLVLAFIVWAAFYVAIVGIGGGPI